MKCVEDAATLKNFIENDHVYDFLAKLNQEFNQVREQIDRCNLCALYLLSHLVIYMFLIVF